MRPPVERYCRCVVTVDSIELVAGIQMLDSAEFFDLLAASQRLMRDAMDSLAGSHAVANPARIAEAVEQRIVAQWPERYWFLEVSSTTEREGWTQVFFATGPQVVAGAGGCMSHDPWQWHFALTCPACAVKGKIVRNNDDYEAYDGSEAPYVCADCGNSWVESGVVGDVKDYRVAYGRLVEGRPYEAPRQKEPERAVPPLDLSKLKKTSSPWPPFVIATEYVATAPSDSVGYALSMDTWTMPPSHLAPVGSVCIMSLPPPPIGSELEVVHSNAATGVVTYRFVKK